MPSLFSLALPVTAFQIWFVIYLYLLPFLLYATWASLACMDLARTRGRRRSRRLGSVRDHWCRSWAAPGIC